MTCSTNATALASPAVPRRMLIPDSRSRPTADTLEDAQQGQIRLLHALAVGYRSQHSLLSVNQLLSAWDTWTDHFYSMVSNTTSLMLLFDELSYDGRMSRNEHLDSIVIKNMGAVLVDCLQPSSAPTEAAGAAGCAADGMLHLDQGYRVYANAFPAAAHAQPLIIFAALHRFAPPAWLSASAELALLNKWKPPHVSIPGGYEYTKMTSWYGYPVLTLQLLDLFDYLAKVDDDLYFTKPFPEPNLPLKMARAGAYLLGPGGGLVDDGKASIGLHAPVDAYVAMESSYCNGFHRERHIALLPGGLSNKTFFRTDLTVMGYFVVTWLGLYTSPESMHFGQFWNSFHPHGIWDYRWTDQQWWPRPIALFGSGNLTKEVLHLAEFDPDQVDNVFHKLVCKNPLQSYQLFRWEGMTRAERQKMIAHCRPLKIHKHG